VTTIACLALCSENAMIKKLLLLSLVLTGCLTGQAQAQTRPLVTGFAPQTGPIGTALTITGSGFAAGAGQNVVYVGGARATVTAASATQLTVTVPGGAVAPAQVVVTNTATRLRGEATARFRLTAAGGTLNANTFRRIDNTFTDQSRVLICADVNADGHADVLANGFGDIQLGLGTGTGTLQVPPIGLTAGSAPTALITEDFTGDGQPDLITLNAGPPNDISFFESLGGSGFRSAQVIYSQPSGSSAYAAVAGDFNSDGRLDLGLSLSNAPIALLLNQGNGTFISAPTTIAGRLLAASDISGDGLTDLLVEVNVSTSSSISTFLRVYSRNSLNTGYNGPEITALDMGNNTVFRAAPSLTDFNQDGLPDLIGFHGASGNSFAGGPLVIRLRNSTNTGFNSPASYPSLTGVGPAPLIGDFDGDGFPDVVVQGSAGLVLGRNDGAGGMVLAGSFSNNNGVLALGVGDLNNDGRADLVSGSFTSVVSVYLNTAGAPGQNNPPTLNPLMSLQLVEDDPEQTVALSGVSNGGEPGQGITLTAVSSDPGLIPNPTISYFSPGSTGTLRLRPAPDAFGTCTITVTASDGQAQNGTFSRTFQVTVNPVNDPPTLDVLPDMVLTGPADGSSQHLTVTLSGISAGPANEQQTAAVGGIIVTLTGNTSIVNNGRISYTPGARNGAVSFSVFRHSVGLLATVTVTFNDGQSFNNTFNRTFRVYGNPNNNTPGQPTTAPTLDLIADVQANRSLTQQVPVALAGIDDGDPNQTLPLTVTATSSDPGLVAVGPVSYTSPGTSGAVPYAISGTRSGTALVTVTVSNGQPSNSTITRSFRVTVPALATSTGPVRVPGSPELALYPNPSLGGRSRLAVQGVSGPVTVRVLDALGRAISTQHWPACPASIELQAGDAPTPGVYLVQLTSQQGTFTRRLLVE
jgi:hypothetical protein